MLQIVLQYDRGSRKDRRITERIVLGVSSEIERLASLLLGGLVAGSSATPIVSRVAIRKVVGRVGALSRSASVSRLGGQYCPGVEPRVGEMAYCNSHQEEANEPNVLGFRSSL